MYIEIEDANGQFVQTVANTGNANSSYTVEGLSPGTYGYQVDRYYGDLGCSEITGFSIGGDGGGGGGNDCTMSLAAGTYYLDASGGDDANDGLSPSTAWQSFCHVNNGSFAAGTTILLKCGETWNESLKPISSGTASAPNIISSYGSCTSNQDKPHIAANGQFQLPVHLYNIEYWEVSNLQISNNTPNDSQFTGAHGVRIEIDNFGTANHIYVQNCFIHDIDGNNTKASEGANGLIEGHGIRWDNKGTTISTFNDLRIENNVLERVDRNAIKGGGYWERTNWHPSTNVVIRGNEMTDIGGDGIVVIGTDGALVEYNVLRYFRMRPPLTQRDCSAGIWPWSADNTLIQYNEAAFGWGRDNWGCDAQGFDADYNCVGTTIQYNYSHNNDGGFILLINHENGGAPYYTKMRGATVRYNVSVDDGAYKQRLIEMTGDYDDAYVYNNVFYMSEGNNIDVFHQGFWEGFPINTYFYNNIFYLADGATATYDSEYFNSHGVLGNNIFFGPGHNNLSSIVSNPNTSDPLFAAPGTGGANINDLSGYQLLPNSPAIDAGFDISGFIGTDFWGNTVPASVTDIGAYETTQSCMVGGSCNDGNACTTNDTYQDDCSCVGTYQDSDTDGVCDANDLCPGGLEPGTACDDGNENTTNDVIQADCSCLGNTQPSQDCPNLLTNGNFESGQLTPWSPWTPAGTAQVVSNNAHEGSFSLRLSGGQVSVEHQFNNLSPNTSYTFSGYSYKTVSADDVMIGVKDYGGDQLMTPSATGNYTQTNLTFTTGSSNTSVTLFFYAAVLTGDAFGDTFTLKESNCDDGNCQDSDSDGVCDDVDQCPGFDDSLIGTACNDGDPCTVNDTYQSDCNCAGTFQDSDNDGVCDLADQCPGIDDNSPSCQNCSTALYTSDFETGWGIWNDGGRDCRRDVVYANSGTYSIRLRDNDGSASSVYSDALDLSDYSELDVSFSYYPRSMDNSREDFFLEISLNGGNSFSILEEWNYSDEFVNDQRYNDVVNLAGPFSTNTVLRFRCDASGNSDWVYLDDIVISGCSPAAITNDNGNDRNLTNAAAPFSSPVQERLNTDVLQKDFLRSIAPNPFTDLVRISLDEKHSFHTLQVVSLSGQVVKTLPITDRSLVDLDLSGTATVTGLLFLRFVGDDHLETAKVIRRN